MSCGSGVEIGGLFDIPNAKHSTFRNVTAGEACPKCGGDVRLLDGTFDVTDDLISVLTAPRWTWDTLRDLKRDLEWARDNFTRQPDEALSRLRDYSPEAANLVASRIAARNGPTPVELISTILAAIAVLLALYQASTTPSKQDIQDAVQTGVENALERDKSTRPGGGRTVGSDSDPGRSGNGAGDRQG